MKNLRNKKPKKLDEVIFNIITADWANEEHTEVNVVREYPNYSIKRVRTPYNGNGEHGVILDWEAQGNTIGEYVPDMPKLKQEKLLRVETNFQASLNDDVIVDGDVYTNTESDRFRMTSNVGRGSVKTGTKIRTKDNKNKTPSKKLIGDINDAMIDKTNIVYDKRDALVDRIELATTKEELDNIEDW